MLLWFVYVVTWLYCYVVMLLVDVAMLLCYVAMFSYDVAMSL